LKHQQYNVTGVSDILNGFYKWYDVANTKLKSFVRGPAKINTSHIANSSGHSYSGMTGTGGSIAQSNANYS